MFRDTSMDYLSRDEVLEIWNHNMRLTDEQLLAMDETEFRARVITSTPLSITPNNDFSRL